MQIKLVRKSQTYVGMYGGSQTHARFANTYKVFRVNRITR